MSNIFYLLMHYVPLAFTAGVLIVVVPRLPVSISWRNFARVWGIIILTLAIISLVPTIILMRIGARLP